MAYQLFTARMTAYYNENDRFAAAWLRELITHGFIAPGDVDERSIEDVTPNDLRGYRQAHFFAGIGGWSYALQLAGWPNDRPVWTGSCPCQPFSAAGKGRGFADERHLWPAWFWLIQQCRPSIIFGEQVANATIWLDLVSTDLEGENYACAATVLGAHSVNAPHIRQRLYWVGYSRQSRGWRDTGGIPSTQSSAQRRMWDKSNESQLTGSMGHASTQRQQQHAQCDSKSQSGAESPRGSNSGRSNPWSECIWIECRDGKRRPIEPGSFPLAYGVPGRVGLLRGYGNAIVPQVAAEFVKCAAEYLLTTDL